jgi:hypothetical protein
MQPKSPQNESLIALENTLKKKLYPVQPNQHFVQKLRTRLEKSNILDRQQRTAATYLTIAGGLLIGLAIFLIGRGFLRKPNEA